jgi:hypothetical protein
VAQLAHAAAPLKLYVDAGQVRQIAAPKEGENEPAGQAAQLAAAVPGLVTVP